MRLAERFKQLRKQLNLSQEEFAKDCGVKFTAISKYETELIKPAFDMLSRIGMTYNVNLNWLVNELGSMFIETPERQIVKTGTDSFSIELTGNKNMQTSSSQEIKHDLSLNNDLKVEYYGTDNNSYTKIYHKNGDVELVDNKKINDDLEFLVSKLNEICKDKNQFEFVITAIKALNDQNALNELKYLIKGIEISNK